MTAIGREDRVRRKGGDERSHRLHPVLRRPPVFARFTELRCVCMCRNSETAGEGLGGERKRTVTGRERERRAG